MHYIYILNKYIITARTVCKEWAASTWLLG